MRCYDGCPDDELKAKMERTAYLEKKMKYLEWDAHCVYFPGIGEGYQVWLNHEPITGLHWNKEDALNEAIKVLEKERSEHASQ